jgi:hypothetical protein
MSSLPTEEVHQTPQWSEFAPLATEERREKTGTTIRNVIYFLFGKISGIGKPIQFCALIGVLVLYDSGPPLTQHNIKRGYDGAREPTFTVSTVPPQTLTNRSNCEGAESRGTAHRAAATAVLFTPTPLTPITTTAAVMSSSPLAQGTSK